MNIYHITPDIIRFNIFNLLGDKVGIAGHYTIYYNIKSDKYMVFKKGDFGSLTWFPKNKNPELFTPTKEQHEFLMPYIQKRLKTACYYNEKAINFKGDFLLPSMKKETNTNLKQYFVWNKDEHCDEIQKKLDELSTECV